MKEDRVADTDLKATALKLVNSVEFKSKSVTKVHQHKEEVFQHARLLSNYKEKGERIVSRHQYQISILATNIAKVKNLLAECGSNRLVLFAFLECVEKAAEEVKTLSRVIISRAENRALAIELLRKVYREREAQRTAAQQKKDDAEKTMDASTEAVTNLQQQAASLVNELRGVCEEVEVRALEWRRIAKTAKDAFLERDDYVLKAQELRVAATEAEKQLLLKCEENAGTVKSLKAVDQEMASILRCLYAKDRQGKLQPLAAVYQSEFDLYTELPISEERIRQKNRVILDTIVGLEKELAHLQTLSATELLNMTRTEFQQEDILSRAHDTLTSVRGAAADRKAQKELLLDLEEKKAKFESDSQKIQHEISLLAFELETSLPDEIKNAEAQKAANDVAIEHSQRKLTEALLNLNEQNSALSESQIKLQCLTEEHAALQKEFTGDDEEDTFDVSHIVSSAKRGLDTIGDETKDLETVCMKLTQKVDGQRDCLERKRAELDATEVSLRSNTEKLLITKNEIQKLEGSLLEYKLKIDEYDSNKLAIPLVELQKKIDELDRQRRNAIVERHEERIRKEKLAHEIVMTKFKDGSYMQDELSRLMSDARAKHNAAKAILAKELEEALAEIDERCTREIQKMEEEHKEAIAKKDEEIKARLTAAPKNDCVEHTPPALNRRALRCHLRRSSAQNASQKQQRDGGPNTHGGHPHAQAVRRASFTPSKVYSRLAPSKSPACERVAPVGKSPLDVFGDEENLNSSPAHDMAFPQSTPRMSMLRKSPVVSSARIARAISERTCEKNKGIVSGARRIMNLPPLRRSTSKAAVVVEDDLFADFM